MSQQMEVPQTLSLGRLTVPNMGTIDINDRNTLTIARAYLEVLENKLKENNSEIQEIKIEDNIEEEHQIIVDDVEEPEIIEE
ncbi:MAG: hypothetical protein HRU07_06875 [Nitrosopumilus sp.]|nr:hypothetical protein [Nitrosopumilus sp.]NRA05862.1 hypothetical protein [Nitrosopumilus sp.]